MNTKKYPVRYMLLFYLICFAFRWIEYIFIRTDQSIIGEAFIHKVIGIVLLAAALRHLQYKWSDIGFRKAQMVRGLCFGLVFGGIAYTIAYCSELLMHISAGNSPSLQFFVTSYTVQGNRAMQGGALFILICIAGNIINVIMEEGIFRGLFMRLAEAKYSFVKACILASFLFGLWHIAQPVRNVIDGVQSPGGAVMMALMLVLASMLGGIQYVLMYKLTGSLWAGMAAHFVNNTIVNLLHVVTIQGVDELQSARITIASLLSFIAVLILLLLQKRKNN